jgi:EmrB/QacA subfamily drug resistance transporter
MPQAIETTGAADVQSPAHRRSNGDTTVVLYLSLGGLAFAVLQSLVVPALSTIGRDLGASTSDVSWVITVYLLSASVLTPILGRLGDIAGKRKVLIGVLATLAVGTLLAALATNLATMIVARVLQGAAGAILPLSIGIVRDALPGRKVSVIIGLLSAIFSVGAGVGIVAAGPIVEHLTWQWLFWLPLALVVVALLGAVFTIEESPVRTPGRLDLLGAAVLSAGLVALLTAVSKGEGWGWDQPRTLVLLVLGVAGLTGFVVIECRVAEPLVDMRLMRSRAVWATNLAGLILGFATFGALLLFPTLLQVPAGTGYGFGASVSQSGLFLLPTVAMMVVFGLFSGLLSRWFGPRLPMLLGTAAVTAAFAFLTVAHREAWHLLFTGALTGAGIGLALSAISNAIIDNVPATQTGEATSVNTLTRTIGSSVGTAVCAAVISSRTTAGGLPTDDAFAYGFGICALAAFTAVVATLVLPSARAAPAS